MELLRALAYLIERPTEGADQIWRHLGLSPPRADDYTDLFVLQLPPYASIYLGAEGMLGGEARERIAGFFAAVGAALPSEPDHLATLLNLYVRLAEADRASTAHARAALLHEHLLSWLRLYTRKVEDVASATYRAWARLLWESLVDESDALPPIHGVALHLREAPSLADPRLEGTDGFLSGLLAPVQSGMLIVRDDLKRAASELHLGLRAGERRYALSALFSQDAPATLGWLAAEARQWMAYHRDGFWYERASKTATLLDELCASVLDGASA